MTVKELRTLLASLPDDLPVFVQGDGILNEFVRVEETNAHQYNPGGSWFEDYYPEATPDEGETRIKVALIS